MEPSGQDPATEQVEGEGFDGGPVGRARSFALSWVVVAAVVALAVGFGGGVGYTLLVLGERQVDSDNSSENVDAAELERDALLADLAARTGETNTSLATAVARLEVVEESGERWDSVASAISTAVARELERPDVETTEDDRVNGDAPTNPETALEVDEDDSEAMVYDSGFDLAGRPFLGGADAAVTVIELTDYECPFCRRHRQGVMNEVLEMYGDRIRYYVVNFPLNSIHPLAFGAAEAAECASDQGLFWEYSDAMFSTSQRLLPDVLVAIADGLGMDVQAFNDCIGTGAKRPVVVSDILQGEQLGVTGTPAFFINGTAVTGARPLEIFQGAIDAALAEVEG